MLFTPSLIERGHELSLVVIYHTPLRYIVRLICPFVFVKKKFLIHPPLSLHCPEPQNLPS